jgi:hypothetical protein
MAITISIKADVIKAQKFARELSKDAVNAAASNALNKVARDVQRESIDEIAKIRQLKKKVIRGAVRIVERASKWKLRVIVQAFGKSISLKEYSAKQNAQGVTVRVRSKQRKQIRHAFGPGVQNKAGITQRRTVRGERGGKKFRSEKRMPRVLGGHVFLRKYNNRRLPILKLFGPSIPSGFIDKIVRHKQMILLQTEWPREFKIKIEDQLKKLRRKHS